MAGKLARKLMWAVAGTVASRAVRGATRSAMHTRLGAPRLPRPVRRRGGFATGLAWMAGASAVMAIADVLTEQGRNAARVR